jgi:hypothetical protein
VTENTSQRQNTYIPIQQKAPDDSKKKDEQCIELKTSPIVYSKSCNEINVIFTNYASKPLEFGQEHYFEFYNHGKWERISFNKGGIIYAFDAIGYELPSNTSQIMHYSLNQKLHTYILGKYRIYIPFYNRKKKI